MMKQLIKHIAPVLGLSLLPSWVFAAVINVAPGYFTLNTAVASATAGDTLLLSDGVYTGKGLEIDKTLIIRAVNKNATPVLEFESTTLLYPLSVVGDTTDVTFQGLIFGGETLSSGNTGCHTAHSCRFIENEFIPTSGYGFYLMVSLNETYYIGNQFRLGNTLYYNPGASKRAETLVFAGNTVIPPEGYGLSLYYINNLSVIGNLFVLKTNTSFAGTVTFDYGQTLSLLGNRIILDMQPMTSSSSASSARTELINISDWSQLDIKNNIFQVIPGHLAAAFDPTTIPLGETGFFTDWDFLNISTVTLATIENNVFDFESISRYSLDAASTFTSDIIDLGSNTLSTVIRNNLFKGAMQQVLNIGSINTNNVVIEHNLCMDMGSGNTQVICHDADRSNETVSDIGFVDLIDYRLAESSTANNTGHPDLKYTDLDGSRNDRGIYGGSYAIDQFDGQRSSTITAPFIYPLSNANNSFNGDGNLSVKMLGVSRLH